MSKKQEEMSKNREEMSLITCGILSLAAFLKRPIFYTELAHLQDTFSGSAVQNRALYDQVEIDKHYERALLSSLVISNKTYLPSQGFDIAAIDNGYIIKDRNEFIRTQQLECFKQWDITNK